MLDTGKLVASWQRYEVAKDAGRESSSPAAFAHAMAEQAYVLIELGEAGSAVQLADHARSVADDAVPPLLLAWLWAVQAEAYAAAGDDLRCRKAFETAEQILPADYEDPDLPYITLDDVHFARWRGNAWALLGDARAIEDLHTALVALDPSFRRARAGLHVDLASALMAANDAGGAREQLQEAERLAVGVGSARQRRRVRRLESLLEAG